MTRRLQRRIWRAVRGQVVDVVNHHPEYFLTCATPRFVDSVAKRVYGEVERLLREQRVGTPATKSAIPVKAKPLAQTGGSIRGTSAPAPRRAGVVVSARRIRSNRELERLEDEAQQRRVG